MKKQAGPASKEYTSLERLQARLADADDNLIVGKCYLVAVVISRLSVAKDN